MVTTKRNSINIRGHTQGVRLLPDSFAGTPIALVECDKVSVVRVKQGSSQNFYQICNTCASWTLIGPAVKEQYITISTCNNCHNEWHFQSLEIEENQFSTISNELNAIQEPGFASMTLSEAESLLNEGIWSSFSGDMLTDRARSDLKSYSDNLYAWVMGGRLHGKSFLGSYISIPIIIDSYVNLMEDVSILLFTLLTSNGTASRYMAVVTFCKLRGSRLNTASMLCFILSSFILKGVENSRNEDEYWKSLQKEVEERISFESQDDSETNPFYKARSFLDQWDKLKDTMLCKKLYSFGLYVLASGLLDHTRINFESMNFSKFEADCIMRTHRPGITMIQVLLDTVLFVCERGYEYFQSGDIHTIFHSGSSYEKWVAKSQKLIRDSHFLNNPEPHGINKFTYLSDLKEAIEKGKGIVKFTAGLERAEKLLLQKLLNDMQLIECNELTKREAQKPRKDPFAMLIHGASNICKSQLKQILFYHYGKYFDLPTTPEFMYTRSPTDEYWSGFDSTQWCVVMDDIAFLRPNGGEVDPTLAEMLQVKNSVPFTPPQAALEDKGRTPVRAELLIGTTNTMHLNLNAYFACPFAIARRFSYVLTATVKPEYSKYGMLADSTLIPKTEEGEYMNIWNFKVNVPVPASDKNVDAQQTRYKLIAEFSDINDMLAWYIEVAKAHALSQSKAMDADKVMSGITICKDCGRTTKACVCFAQQDDEDPFRNVEMFVDQTNNPQVDEIPIESMRNVTLFKFWFYSCVIRHSLVEIPYENEFILILKTFTYPCSYLFMLLFYMKFKYMTCALILLCIVYASKYIWICIAYYFQWQYGSLWKIKVALYLFSNENEAYRYIFRMAGNRINNSVRSYPLKKLAIFIGVLGAALSSKVLFDKIFPKKKYKQQASEGVVPKVNTVEKPTFYYHDPIKLTGMDISSQSKTSQGDILSSKIEKNTACFLFRWLENDKKCNATIGLNIHGQIWMFNKHAIRGETGTVDVIFDDVTTNVSRNLRNITISKQDIVVTENNDLAFIELRAIPPGSRLVDYFPLNDQLPGVSKGMYFLINKNGIRSNKNVASVVRSMCPVFGVPAYRGQVDEATVKGNCGAPCLSNAGNSSVILGIHAAGNGSHGVSMIHVSQTMLLEVLKRFSQQVERGTIYIDAPGFPRNLVDIHPKSTLRFVEQGTANIMGSFSGFRYQPKSRVTSTYIRDEVVKDGYKSDYGKPDMTWKPWSLAIHDMTKPVHTFQNSILRECEDAFFSDICEELNNDFSQIEVYTQDVALNGVDGVTYVDRLNTHTSAGLPFKCPKTAFIKFDDNNKIIGLDDVVQDRIRLIEATYDSGKRFHPQFCGHLKDEPTSFKKINAGKTRVFTGGEFAWSVVVRRFYLSHIRLMQNNPFVFEAMPGIVAQSNEWSDLYRYLTQFGDNKIIAGDYGKFDKKMAAPFILSAFEILIRMSQKAGWSENDLTVLRCIAYDTAFPTIDFNGDLIEIQGNPSGHPLTVIINCLVNSLYMRYAFYLTTKKNPKEFKRYVKLATYGDDNIMGVSDDCPMFNHTRIATALNAIGVEYTMAEKEAESVPYIHINDASFLKRRFVFNQEMGAYMAVLDIKSIDKMLTSYLDTGVLAKEAHSICVIETALREYFFHGREVFESKRSYFQELVKRCNLQLWVRNSTFPTYDELGFEFWKRGTIPRSLFALEKMVYFQEKMGVNPVNPIDSGLTSPDIV
nr:MAG: hypothetical protein 1 [Marnaviridae sp.]